MSNLIRDTLDAWREAERLAESLPPQSAGHERAQTLAAELRVRYRRLSAATRLPGEMAEEIQRAIDETRALRRAHDGGA